MIKIGITGGIGSGKSTLCRHFSDNGTPIYNSDQRAKGLLNRDKELRVKVIEIFGEEAYTEYGELNKQYIAAQIFGDDAKRQAMNSVVHPAVVRDFVAWADMQSDVPYVILESALLFDAGLECEVDKSVAVLAPEDLRVKRCVERDGASEESVRERIAAQLSDDEYNAKADFTVVNIFEDDLAGAAQRLDQIFRKLAFSGAC